MRFRLVSGEDIEFWEDTWCGNAPLKEENIYLLP